MFKYLQRVSMGLLVSLLFPALAAAHFPWMLREPDGKLALYFGEALTDRTYKLPSSLAEAKVIQLSGNETRIELKVEKVETDDFIGLKSEAVVPTDATFASHMIYGIYHGSRLDYYVLHFGSELPTTLDAAQPSQSELDFSIELSQDKNDLTVRVRWKDAPIADLEVQLFGSDGKPKQSEKTDPEGKASFPTSQLDNGLNAILVGHNVRESGKLDGAEYAVQAHYLTATFHHTKKAEPHGNNIEPQPLGAASTLPSLPIEVTSFGACRSGDAIYVFGGHTGEAHSYSIDAQNDKLLKLDLKALEKGWQELSTGPRIQGLGMVAHEQSLILVGGFTAMNAEGDEHNLHSQSSVHRFDLASETWSELPPLPTPRSSHDAALVDDTLYVVGGWNMQGEDNTQWHTTGWAMDLSQAQPAWVEIATPPFERRALATVAHKGKLFAIGGMNKEGGPTRETAFYDPATNTWTLAAELIGDKDMAGFGAASWSTAGQLVATTYEGTVQHWNEADKSWSVVGRTADARFFHRLLPLDSKHLVSIGGANMEVGKYTELETITVDAKDH